MCARKADDGGLEAASPRYRTDEILLPLIVRRGDDELLAGLCLRRPCPFDEDALLLLCSAF